jgi:adenylate cyclase
MAFVLQLFGGFRLIGEDGKPVPLPDRARALLAYLAVEPSPVPRQVLAELLSAEGDEQEQRTALRQAVYLVRKAMGDAVISGQEGDLVLNGALVRADVRLFQSAMAQCGDHSLPEAVELYRGPFLDGEKSPSSAFEEWLMERRRDFMERTLEALLKLARSDAVAGLHGSALGRARRALTLDPLREDIHRQVMRSLAAMGQRSNALRQYDTVRQALSKELGVAPERETEALRDTIARCVEPVSSGWVAGVPRASGDVIEASGVADQAGGATHSRVAVPATSWLFAAKGGSTAIAWLPLAIVLLIVLGVASWSLPTGPRFLSPPITSTSNMPAATVAPRLSIVVLPFANLSGDPNQEYFADGITDDLTTDLSRIDGSFVISRHTAFTYKGRYSVDIRQVGRELGIRYVLTGSVRRSGERVHINAELVDAATGAKSWAERFEGSLGNLPALHNDVTGRIAATLRLELIEAEGRRVESDHESDPAAADEALRGWAILYRLYSRESRAEARGLFESAIARDPNTVSALIGLAHVLEGYSNSPIEDQQRADELLQRALHLEPNRAATHFVLGKVRQSQGRLLEAAAAFQAAIALDRNYARAYLYLGLTVERLGRPEETLALAERAMRLNPRDPNIADHYWIIGSAQILLGRADEAIESLRRACAANPRLWYMHLQLAAAYGMEQRIDEAKRELAVALRLRPEFSSLAAIRAGPQSKDPAYLALAERTLFVGLRRAGLPE